MHDSERCGRADQHALCGVAEVRYRGLREETLVVATTVSLQLQAERGVVAVLAPQHAAQRAAGGAAGRKVPVEGAYVKVFARVNGMVRHPRMHGLWAALQAFVWCPQPAQVHPCICDFMHISPLGPTLSAVRRKARL